MALREIAAQFDIRISGADKLTQLNKNLDKSSGMLSGLSDKLRDLGQLVAGAFALKGLDDFIKRQADLGLELQATSQILGMNTDNLQKWQYATEVSGVSAEAFAHSVERLNHSIGVNGLEPEKLMSAALTKLGVKTKDSNGHMRDLNDILLDTADGFAKMTNQQERTGVAMTLFGRSGARMLPLLQQGRKGIQQLTAEAEANGYVLGQDWVKAARDAAIEQRKLDWSTRALKATIGKELFPVFKSVVDQVIKGVNWFKELTKNTTIVTTGLSALAFVSGVSLFGAISRLMGFSKGGGVLGNLFGMTKLAAILVGLALLYLAWDELFGLFTGKKTVIGDAIDAVYGKGQSTKDVNELKEAWKGVLDAIFGAGKATGDWDEIWGSLKSTLLTDLAAIVHSIMTMVTLLMRAGNLATILANEAGKAIAGKGFDSKKVEGAFDLVKAAAKNADFSALGGALTPAIKADHLAPSYRGMIEPSAQGQKHITIHQTNHIHGGDPDKVRTAIHQGTTSALSQGDLRNAYQATRSATPAQGQNFNPMGNP